MFVESFPSLLLRGKRQLPGEHDYDRLDSGEVRVLNAARLNPEEVAERSEALDRVLRASAIMRQLAPHLKTADSIDEALASAGIAHSTYYDEVKRLKIDLS